MCVCVCVCLCVCGVCVCMSCVCVCVCMCVYRIEHGSVYETRQDGRVCWVRIALDNRIVQLTYISVVVLPLGDTGRSIKLRQNSFQI